MKKLILCASLVAAGMMVSCEKELLVPEGAENKPEWLGGSIYEELRSGAHLTGTFNTYLRLIDDLGYNEILSRTGSKTIFPANDEAFERFFKKNQYGVTSYDQLTEGMKAQILKSSMIDNAMLAGMLSNVKVDDNNVSRGKAIKHATNVSLSDSITYYATGDQMPQNNTYWDEYRRKGIHVVSDNTVPMMVHFTREQMLGNAITTTGVDSDFGILRGELKGSSISNSDTAYIFQTRIVNQDVTCTNGYIHQIGDVLVPPGNVPQVMRNEANTKLFSRILDYHCAPYYDETTTNDYNSWAMQNGRPTIDSIYQIRYFSTKSQGNASNIVDPVGIQIASERLLDWDLGWNQYYSSTNAANSLNDIGAILVPTDQAIKDYFLPGGGGAYFIELYSQLPNTEANLPYNLDSLFNNATNGILTTFVNNLIQTSFVATVPSKFGTITNEGSGDFMGLTRDDINVTDDGRYDVVVANNGVIYKMKSMIAPDIYQSVIGPAVTYPDMSVMGHFSQDRTSGSASSIFGADMYYYLMAMKANYLYFIPDDEALKGCFIDPVSLGTDSPRALEFYSYKKEDDTEKEGFKVYYGVKIHDYDPAKGIISPDVNSVEENIEKNKPSTYASQVYDMLNYNTVVLDAGEEITNRYYLTKHGGAIRIDDFRDDGGNFTGTVSGGAQIDNNLTPAKIEQGWREKNGWAFRLDNVIQPAITSVYKLLDNNKDRFQSFLDLCAIFDDYNLMEWVDISGAKPANGGVAPRERYYVFSGKEEKALDMNVNFFNGYNYTFYAPDNAAMEKAHNEMGLPRYEELSAIYDQYGAEDDTNPEVIAAKQRVKDQLNIIRAFIRYHFQNNSVFADNYVKETTYQSMYSSELGIPVNITTKSTDGVLTVTDARGAGHEIVIDANDGTRLANKMTRDIEYDKERKSATAIAVSSFAVVHQISEPLCFNKSGKFNE